MIEIVNSETNSNFFEMVSKHKDPMAQSQPSPLPLSQEILLSEPKRIKSEALKERLQQKTKMNLGNNKKVITTSFCTKLYKDFKATICTPSDSIEQAKMEELFILKCQAARTNFIAVFFMTITDLILNDRMKGFGNVVINQDDATS